MNKTVKIFAAALTLTLVSCGGGSSQLSEAEARAQVAAMKAEVSKDEFATPSSGMQKTDVTISNGGSTLALTTDLRFDTNKGSRYLYYKYTGIMMSSEFCQYEKDGKYYCYSSSSGSTTFKEFTTEAEFTESFNEAAGIRDVDLESLKDTAAEFLDSVNSIYDGQTQTSSGYTVSYGYAFNKINDSSFIFDVTMSMTNDSGETGTAVSSIEVENYLPKKRYIEANSTEGGQSTKIVSTETFTWGSVDYVYITQTE